MTSLEWPVNCLRTEGSSERVQTVKVPSDAPYASRSELIWPNFRTVTTHKKTSLTPRIKKKKRVD